MTAVEFPTSLFTDPSRAQRSLRTIHEMFIASGSHFPLDVFSEALHGQLLLSPDPDKAITNLFRFAEATVSKASLFNDLVKYPVTLEVLLKVFSFSQYLADILVRDPELFRWLTASDVLMIPKSKSALAFEVQRIEKMFAKPERRLDSLRRLYRREMLRIGAKDILDNADLAMVTQELSDLADVLIDASCRLAELTLREKYGNKPQTPYAVIGLGKLGGGELNYSSDIDIIFVYAEEGELPTSKRVTYHEYFNKFVEKAVQNLSHASGEGYIYRVDTRLRPESGMGPLARSVQSYLLYYESRGELWERQMLIKARPVAGDLDFGEKFLRQLTPFVYPRTFFTHPTEAIARIKARIEVAVAGDDNIKLRAGGIRDIEFIIQALQLLNGGKNERVRSRNTLHAIALLTAEKLLSAEEDIALTDAYVFFRTLEHRLQAVYNTQTHSLPDDPREQTVLAKKMNLKSSNELVSQVESSRKQVRKIFEAVLKVGGGDEVVVGVEALMDGGMGEEQVSKVLAGFGFKETHRATKVLKSIVSSSGLTGSSALDTRARDAFRHVAALVFEGISQLPSADLALNNLGTLIAAHRFPEQLFGALKEEGFRKLILTVCGTSPRLARGLAKDELLLELLASNSTALAQAWNGKRRRNEKFVLLKEREELRAGIRHVLGISSFRDYTIELSRLADEAIASVFEEESKKRGLRRPSLAVFALGKYGTRELSVDADLDVLFIGELKTKGLGKLEKIASGIIQKLSDVSSGGKLYDVDARLRPEGRNAPLVVDKKAYAVYLRERASLWERQSLTRMRFVCGDASLAGGIASAVASFVYETPLPPTWTDEIVAMRRKVETRSHTRSSDFFDVKLGLGGMVDIEFIAQMIHLKFGSTTLSQRFLPTTDVLEVAPSAILSAEHASFLTDAYGLYRRIELMMRLSLEDRSTILPMGDKLELLANVLGVSTGVELQTMVAENMKSVRSHFVQVAKTLSSTD
jgi:[glutamine synthetase] adenylyltransferase / [glutamine synthetase]-adenylyl-L-tyrosine phosphorylase